MSAKGTSFLVPNVTSVPSRSSPTEAREAKAVPGEFKQMFDQALDQIKSPLKFSAHATQRLDQRSIQMDDQLVGKLNKAVDQAEAKGIEDTLVLTDQGAFIVNIKNRTVVTALDRHSLNGNVFTNIDGAVVV